MSETIDTPTTDDLAAAQADLVLRLADAEQRATQAESACWRLHQALATLHGHARDVCDQHDAEVGDWQSVKWQERLEAAERALKVHGATNGPEGQ